MLHAYGLLALACITSLARGGPLDVHAKYARQAYTTTIPCGNCLTSWTRQPVCTQSSDVNLDFVISAMLNPPPEAAATYTASEWCSEELRPTDFVVPVFRTTSTLTPTTTRTRWKAETRTTTDVINQTSTKFCPKPTAGTECGWDSDMILDFGQGLMDIRIDKPEDCQQECLRRATWPDCGAYRVVEREPGTGAYLCQIFKRKIDQTWKDWRSGNSAPGTQWYNRDCPDHAPKQCKAGHVATTGADALPRTTASPPIITPGPTLVPRVAREVEADEPGPLLAKRETKIPEYFTTVIPGVLQYFYLSSACSCIITSAPPLVTRTSSRTDTSYPWLTSTITLTSSTTIVYTEVVRATTTYVSID